MMIGRTISHYRVLEKLGAGGMGVVYKAEDLKLRRIVALKFLPPHALGDEEEKTRLIHEAQAAAALDHPNICTVYEIDEVEGEIFIAMAYIEGETLRSRIRRESLSLHQALEFAMQLALALEEAHGKGIVHRDIKTANIMVTPRGQLKVMDFGLVQLSGQTKITRTGTTVGTPGYMAPEQARGEAVDQRADLWALGVVFYEMITCRMPFKGASEVAVVHSILYEPPQPISDLRAGVPPALEQIIEKALTKRAGQRYQQAEEMLADLVALRKELESGAITATTAMTISTGNAPSRRSSRAAAPAAIAVLPFADLSPERDQEYFCEGMAEEVINALAQVEGLRVVSRSSSFQFRGKSYDIREVGEKLSVGAVLEGSVRRAGNRLRITAQLVNVADGFHLWSERYDREMKDVFDIQDEISRAIVTALKIKLVSEQQQLVKRYTENLEAYHLYLKGRYWWNKRIPGAMKKALEYFQQALAEDPNYALAHAGVSDCYIVPGYYGTAPTSEVLPRAKSAAMTALKLDPDLGEAHASMGAIAALYEWDWGAAENHFREAIEHNPGYANAPMWQALFHLASTKRLDEALAVAKKSRELDPLNPPPNSAVGIVLYYQRQYEPSLRELHKTLELDPNVPVVHYYLGKICLTQGKPEEAASWFQKARDALGNNPAMIAGLGLAYGVWGKRAEAEALIDELKSLSAEHYVPAHCLAMIYIGLGDKDRAFEWLEKGYEERSPFMINLAIDPCYDTLRPDPRFDSLLKRLGLAS